MSIGVKIDRPSFPLGQGVIGAFLSGRTFVYRCFLRHGPGSQCLVAGAEGIRTAGLIRLNVQFCRRFGRPFSRSFSRPLSQSKKRKRDRRFESPLLHQRVNANRWYRSRFLRRAPLVPRRCPTRQKPRAFSPKRSPRRQDREHGGGQRLWRGCCVIAGLMTGPPSIVRSIPSG